MTEQHQYNDANEQEIWAAVGGLDASYLGWDAPEPPAGRHAGDAAPVQLDRGLSLAGRPQEMRALWVTRWDYRTADDVRTLMDQAAHANFNAILFQVRGNADALYPSRLEPWSKLLTGTPGQDPGWDPLSLAVDEAHARGLELHAYVNVYPAWLGETPPPPTDPETMYDRFNRLYGDDWVMWDRDQKPMQLNREYLWANPAHGAVMDQVEAVCRDILARYYVDGIHLDNVRYASWEYSRDPYTLEQVALAQASEPELDRQEWQRRQVSTLVGRLFQAIDEVKPGLLLSAAVWPVYRDTWDWWSTGDGYSGFCQDSVGWLRARIIDAISPMLYLGSIITDDQQFELLVRDFVARSGRGVVYPGISANYDDFATIAHRIDVARQAGAEGQAIFSHGYIRQRQYWDQFRSGPYATPAIVLPPERTRERISNRLRTEAVLVR